MNSYIYFNFVGNMNNIHLKKIAWATFSTPPSQFKGSTSSDRSRSNTQTKELAPAKFCSKVRAMSADIDGALYTYIVYLSIFKSIFFMFSK